MTALASPRVSVIVACHNAERTLGRAIRSALAEPETAEVIVIDDASTDGTVRVARAEAAGAPRVRLIALDTNAGPAAARNRGLDAATAPFVAVLDSDDIFLPGRLRTLLNGPPRELAADNILFMDDRQDGGPAPDWPDIAADFSDLTLTQFVEGNLRRKGTARGELGFLKPVMSREFLTGKGLRYAPSMRLGEDYDLYVRMFLAGARMTLTRRPGYAATVRATSLSARHATADLAVLHARIEEHLKAPDLTEDVAARMRALSREVRHKHDHRRFLDLRRSGGAAAAIRFALGGRNRLGPIATQIARDKLHLNATAADALPKGGTRLLLDPRRT